MSEIYNKNISEFGKKYPGEVDYLKNEIKKEHNTISGVENIEERKILYVIKDEIQYQLDSMYSNEWILNKWYEYMEDNSLFRTYLLFGLGNGMYTRKLINELNKKDCEYSIIIYEPGVSILRTVLEEFDISDIISNRNVHLYISSVSETPFKDMIQSFVTFSNKYGMHWHEYTNYGRLFEGEMADFIDAIQISVGAVNATRYVQERFGEAYYINTFSNIKKMIDSKSLFTLINRIPKEIPAIIVSAGPSLSKNIELLKDAKNKCLMIATDSAVPALLKANIIPDAYVCVDGKKNPKHFMDERVKDIPAFVAPFTSTAALKSGQIQFFLSDDNSHIMNFMEKEDIYYTTLSTGGSVANDCYSLAVLLGITNIILVGQDLAYTGGKTHAANTVRENAIIDQETLTFVKSIDGDMIESSTEFVLYKTWFETQIKYNKSINLIDATEGGAYIEGSRLMTLKDAILQYCKVDVCISEIIRNVDDVFNNIQKDRFKDYIKGIPNELKGLKSLAIKSKRNYEEMQRLAMEGKLGGNSIKKIFENNNEIGERIDKSIVLPYVEYLIQDSIHDVLENAYNYNEDTKKEIIEASKIGLNYANAIINGVDRILKDYEDVILAW